MEITIHGDKNKPFRKKGQITSHENILYNLHNTAWTKTRAPENHRTPRNTITPRNMTTLRNTTEQQNPTEHHGTLWNTTEHRNTTEHHGTPEHQI